jgi:hypothetical protein
MQPPALTRPHVAGHHWVWQYPVGAGVDGLADGEAEVDAVGDGVLDGETDMVVTPKQAATVAKPPAGYSEPTQPPALIRPQVSGFHEVWQ